MATTKGTSEPSTELDGTKKKFKSGNIFSWTNDKIELSLGMVGNFKSDKQGEQIDWESVKTKYEDICSVFFRQIPCKRCRKQWFQASGFMFCGPGYQHSNNLLA